MSFGILYQTIDLGRVNMDFVVFVRESIPRFNILIGIQYIIIKFIILERVSIFKNQIPLAPNENIPHQKTSQNQGMFSELIKCFRTHFINQSCPGRANSNICLIYKMLSESKSGFRNQNKLYFRTGCIHFHSIVISIPIPASTSGQVVSS